VLNGVVMIAAINARCARGGMGVREATLDGRRDAPQAGADDRAGGRARLRADGPLTGAGAEVQRPLATVVIGGIVTSTLLT
jgi:Cu/Ag efflux pump CusA